MRFAGGSREKRDCCPVHLNAVIRGMVIGDGFGVRPTVPFNADICGMVIGPRFVVRPTVPFNAAFCGNLPGGLLDTLANLLDLPPRRAISTRS